MIDFQAVQKHYPLQAGFFARQEHKVYAVNGVSFRVEPGEIYGLVGESGCGKTTTARLLVRMEKLTAGDIVFRDRGAREHHLAEISPAHLKELRNKVRYIFQDPARSLNPRLTIREVLLSGYRYSPWWPGRAQAESEARRLMQEVGLKPGDLERRPADFSGGQRQRISIARALITQPEVIICDEVVSALDVSIQGQILNLLLRLRRERDLTMIFIAHDLAVVGYVSDRIGVMYRGVLVEEAPAVRLMQHREHPYTQYLFESLPVLNAAAGRGSRVATSPTPATESPDAERSRGPERATPTAGDAGGPESGGRAQQSGRDAEATPTGRGAESRPDEARPDLGAESVPTSAPAESAAERTPGPGAKGPGGDTQPPGGSPHDEPAASRATISPFARRADAMVNPVDDPALLVMDESAPGHRVSRMFRYSGPER